MCNRAGHDKVCGQLHPTGDYSILQPGVQEQSISVEIIKPNVVRTYYWVQERCQVKSEIGQFLALAILKYPSLSFRLLYWCMQVSAYIFPFLMIKPTECVLTHGLIFLKKKLLFSYLPLILLIACLLSNDGAQWCPSPAGLFVTYLIFTDEYLGCFQLS